VTPAPVKPYGAACTTSTCESVVFHGQARERLRRDDDVELIHRPEAVRQRIVEYAPGRRNRGARLVERRIGVERHTDARGQRGARGEFPRGGVDLRLRRERLEPDPLPFAADARIAHFLGAEHEVAAVRQRTLHDDPLRGELGAIGVGQHLAGIEDEVGVACHCAGGDQEEGEEDRETVHGVCLFRCVAHETMWCPRSDSNRHDRKGRQILSLLRLPFRHSGWLLLHY
jgi:hypothetical protein